MGARASVGGVTLLIGNGVGEILNQGSVGSRIGQDFDTDIVAGGEDVIDTSKDALGDREGTGVVGVVGEGVARASHSLDEDLMMRVVLVRGD